nr:MAG TPA: hypothetical protein [Caudoviricetes sp.]DAW39893.1 MAG TPA: hypothetical protein [Caudoviricetes sp.]
MQGLTMSPAPPWFVRIGRFFLTEYSFLNKI